MKKILLLLILVPFLFTAACSTKSTVAPTRHPATPQPTKREQQASAKGQRIAKAAASQIGVRYRWGGTTPKKGFDCSGLTLWSYKKVGINLPRRSRDQARTGRAVRKSQLLPGDLVVFKISRSSVHIGIYKARGTFVHSPKSSGVVRLDSLNNPYWKKTFLHGRRIAN